MKLLETSSLAVSLTGGEEPEGDRHAIMIIIIINNIKQRQKRSGKRETMITIKTTAGMDGNNKQKKKAQQTWNVYLCVSYGYVDM